MDFLNDNFSFDRTYVNKYKQDTIDLDKNCHPKIVFQHLLYRVNKREKKRELRFIKIYISIWSERIQTKNGKARAV